jgi:hypothetical protein
MYKAFVTITSSLLLSAVIAYPSATPGARQRNFTGYDVIGPYKIPPATNAENLKVARAVEAKVRAFIWAHWFLRKKGQVTVTELSLEEFRPCETMFVIDPDAKGVWHIKDQWKCKGGHPRSGTYIFTSMKREKLDPSGYKTGVELPDASDVPAESFLLVLHDASGDMVREF